MRTICFSIAAFFLLASCSLGQQGDDSADEDKKEAEAWEREVHKRISQDAKLKRLAARHTLVFLPAKDQKDDEGLGYSFIYKRVFGGENGNRVDLVFCNEEGKALFGSIAENQLAVCLGKGSFEKDVDPKAIGIDHPGIITGRMFATIALKPGEAFLHRVRDDDDNDFFVLYQIVAVHQKGRHVAFLWRELPGGKRQSQKTNK